MSELSVENKLDIADAVQIYAIKEGKFIMLKGESASVLITADEKQETVAKKYGIRVWNCRKEPQPEWLDN